MLVRMALRICSKFQGGFWGFWSKGTVCCWKLKAAHVRSPMPSHPILIPDTPCSTWYLTITRQTLGHDTPPFVTGRGIECLSRSLRKRGHPSIEGTNRLPCRLSCWARVSTRQSTVHQQTRPSNTRAQRTRTSSIFHLQQPLPDYWLRSKISPSKRRSRPTGLEAWAFHMSIAPIFGSNEMI